MTPLRELAERLAARIGSQPSTTISSKEVCELLAILDAEGDGHYSQGVCEDGAAILLDGKRMTVDEIVAALNAKGAEGNDWVVGAWQYRRKTYLGWGNWKELNPEHMGAARDREDVEIRALYAPTQENQVDKCGVCDGPNAYDQESGVCLKCQDVTEGDGGAVGVSPEDRFEQFVAAAIARSPEPLRELGEYLTRVLDEDQWPTADRLLLQLATYTHPARSGVVSDEDVLQVCVDYYGEPAWKFMSHKFGCLQNMRAALEHFAKVVDVASHFTPADAALLREAVSRLPTSRIDSGRNLAFRFDASIQGERHER